MICDVLCHRQYEKNAQDCIQSSGNHLEKVVFKN